MKDIDLSYYYNVSLTVWGETTRQCPQTTTFEERDELMRVESNWSPSAYQPTGVKSNRLTRLRTHTKFLFFGA